MSDEQSSLELSSVVKSCLISFNDSKAPVSLEGIGALVQVICDSLSKVPVPNKFDETINCLKENKTLEKYGTERLTELYINVSSFILTAASENINSHQIESTLKTHNWSTEQISRFLKIFVPYQSKIRAILKLYQTNPPKLVDVNWRLDYQIETSTRGPVNELMYIIELILDDNGVPERLSFTASHAELEHIVNTLKDACQCLKRVALSS